METGRINTSLPKEKDWSQTELATKSGVSREMIGKYERAEAVPSIEAAKKIAVAFEISLDYLVGEGIKSKFDNRRSNVYMILKNWKLETKNMFLPCWMISSLKIKCRQFLNYSKM